MEGKDYITFNGTQITKEIAIDNYAFWKNKLGIPEVFNDYESEIHEQVKKMFGTHTFPAKVNIKKGMIYPFLSIFQYNNDTQSFNPDENGGVICDKIRKGDGRHMGTAKKIGIDKFVFSYLGTHLPYHRTNDIPPVSPFGLFIKIDPFAFNHGSPCDRDFESNDLVDKENLDKYFLLPEDLQKLVTHRIITDPLFNKDFRDYYGNPEIWEQNIDYVNESWKKKGELCYFERVLPEQIAAILWPVWEEYADMDNKTFLPDDFQEYTSLFKNSFNDIKVIFYRPYRDVINKKNWSEINQRDWAIALIEASSLAQKYYMEFKQFPESIEMAKAYFN